MEYNLNFDTGGASMGDMDQFDAFDNYLLPTEDGADNNTNDDNLFMALDTLDFSSDYNNNTNANTNNTASVSFDISNNNFNNVVTKFNHDITSQSQSPPPIVVPSRRTSGQRGRPGFPIHMHEILSQAEALGFANIISWLPHGRAFMVHDMNKLSEVLPKYFAHNKITTFTRQLNAYKFKTINSGVDKGAYYHEYFIRGRVELSAQMSRSKTKHNEESTNSIDPNFYKMPFVDANGKEQINASSKVRPSLPTMSFREKNNSNWQQVLKSYCPTMNKSFPQKNLPTNDKKTELPFYIQDVQSKILKKGILPKSENPLDAVTFFVSLDLLLA